MKGRQRRAGRIAVLAGLLLGQLGVADEAREVGFVERFTGEPAQHAILRRGQPVPVAVFAPLEAGDQLSVKAPGELLVVRVAGRVVELTGEDEVLVLPEAADGADLTTNLAAWVGDWISGDRGPDATRIALSTRSVALAAPSWGAGPAFLVEGRRSLALAWRGGHPPYEVELQRLEPAAGSLGAWSASDDARLVTPPLVLSRGVHRLWLRDAVGADVTLPLQVVAESPEGPLRGDQPLDRTLSAAWLAGRGAGEWRLEAYQRLAPLRASYAPAARLADALERGTPAPPR